MKQRSWKRPEILYGWCCTALAAWAVVPPLIALTVGGNVPGLDSMKVQPYYRPEVIEGTYGVDLYRRFLSASAWADGFSPYREVPERYVYKEKEGPFYPPLTYWLYSRVVPLGYDSVFVLHSVAKVLLFLLIVGRIVWAAGTAALALLTVFACAACILLSPVGWSELLQGQFELFLAAAYALAYASLYVTRKLWVPAAGALASLKISSLTFLAPFSLVAFAADRRRAGSLEAVLAVMLGALALFFPYLPAFLGHILGFELLQSELYADRLPNGVSFARILPYYMGKSVIIVCTAVLLTVLLRIRQPGRRSAAFLAASFPFAVMLLLQGIGFGRGAWEYKAVALLAFVPGLYLWLRTVALPPVLQGLTAGLFTVLTAALLHLFPFRQTFPWVEETHTAWVYLCASFAFLVLALAAVRHGAGLHVSAEKP